MADRRGAGACARAGRRSRARWGTAAACPRSTRRAGRRGGRSPRPSRRSCSCDRLQAAAAMPRQLLTEEVQAEDVGPFGVADLTLVLVAVEALERGAAGVERVPRGGRDGGPEELVLAPADVLGLDVVADAEHVDAGRLDVRVHEAVDLAALHHVAEAQAVVDDLAVTDVERDGEVHPEVLAERQVDPRRGPRAGPRALLRARPPAVIHAVDAVDLVAAAAELELAGHAPEHVEVALRRGQAGLVRLGPVVARDVERVLVGVVHVE